MQLCPHTVVYAELEWSRNSESKCGLSNSDFMQHNNDVRQGGAMFQRSDPKVAHVCALTGIVGYEKTKTKHWYSV